MDINSKKDRERYLSGDFNRNSDGETDDTQTTETDATTTDETVVELGNEEPSASVKEKILGAAA